MGKLLGDVGGRHGSKGYFIQPTVFGDVTMDMKIGQEEIFGPVSSIIKFETEEEALKIANNTSVSLHLPSGGRMVYGSR